MFLQMIEETSRNVQLTMATQALQGRLTAMERSANALRELLKQKFGDQGVVHMMEALEHLGAGANALLEVPVSGAVNVASELFAAPNGVGASGAGGAGMTGTGAHSPSHESTRPDTAPRLTAGQDRGNANEYGYDGTSNTYVPGGKVSPRGYGPSSRPLAGRVSATPTQPQFEDKEDIGSARAYNKAIEGALYR